MFKKGDKIVKRNGSDNKVYTFNRFNPYLDSIFYVDNHSDYSLFPFKTKDFKLIKRREYLPKWW